ncbi:MAG TPA: hypothetical protein VJ819_02045 [Nocardioidaceae bacterium]|nr:hypothetical protein [Nocardioidaceae bacterium]
MNLQTRNWLLLISAGSLLVVSVLIGGVLSVVGFQAANLSSGGADGGTPAGSPSLPVASPSVAPEAPESSSPGRPSEDASPPEQREQRARVERNKKPSVYAKESKSTRITLVASPRRAGSFERIDLEGRYPGGSGATVQVQRRESRWTDFPVSTAVRDGTFSTFVQSGHRGINRFRVVDRSTGRRSNPVSVMIVR